MPRPIITAALTGPVATKADNAGMPGTVDLRAEAGPLKYDDGGYP